MGLHIDPEKRGRTGKIRAGEVGGARNLSEDGIEQIGHGALICPECDAPIRPHRVLAVSEDLRCPCCHHLAAARDYLVADVYDTVGNEVYLIARAT